MSQTVHVLPHPHSSNDYYFSIFEQFFSDVAPHFLSVHDSPSHIHPKTLIEKMWITFLDRVSANAEKGRKFEWAGRVGQRLQLRFGKSGAARKSCLVKIVVEVSEIRGGLPSTWPFEPLFLVGVVAAF